MLANLDCDNQRDNFFGLWFSDASKQLRACCGRSSVVLCMNDRAFTHDMIISSLGPTKILLLELLVFAGIRSKVVHEKDENINQRH